ncbi:MAG: hypothetical protein K2H76_10820, partial [Muribaculaceae bacterium]|nr:hypothetical protein [Muribaculaceae bacterium]
WTFETTIGDDGRKLEICGLPGMESVVDSGPDKGMNLSELIAKYDGELVGARTFSRFGTFFPLLVSHKDASIELRFIDNEGTDVFLAGIEILPDSTFSIQDSIGLEKGDEPVLYDAIPDIPVNVVRSPHFTTNILCVDREVMRDYIEKDTFVVIIALEGDAWLTSRGHRFLLKSGHTALISALSTGLIIEPEGEFTALEAYI